MAFHEVRFPTSISFGARGGPRRKTIVSTSGSGYEHRNSQWANSKRDYNAGYGIRSLDDIHSVISFFEERRGKLHGFRWKDHFDFKSCPPTHTVNFSDQVIGVGDGTAVSFQLIKTYGSVYNPYTRAIQKLVVGTVRVGVNAEEWSTSSWSLNPDTGMITFLSPPPASQVVTAGFEFDVPVRFDTDYLEIDLSAFNAGNVPDIPVVELKL